MKRNLFAYFILCFFFFAVVSCNDYVTFEDNLPEKILPAETGSFSLKLSGMARTILPDVTFSLNDFAVYNLDFTPVSSSVYFGTAAENVDRTNETLLTDPVFLRPGDYKLVVNAYTDNEKTQLMARGTLDRITINPGEHTSAAITLRALLDGAETGVFNWEITVPGGVTATMTIAPGNTGGTARETVLLTSPDSSGSRVLNSGPYNLTFNLENTDGELARWYELLYVYKDLESDFTFTFTDAHFTNAAYTVVYHYDDGVTADQSKSILHGGMLAAPATPAKSGYAFAGWYADDDSPCWNFTSDHVIDSLILSARWVNLTDPQEPAPALSREITVEMRSRTSSGWYGAALRVNVNGTDRSPNATIPSGSNQNQVFYRFTVNADDEVKFYWVKGNYGYECAFAVYYSDNPPSPAFNPTYGAEVVVDTARILLYRQYGFLTDVATGAEFKIPARGVSTVYFDINGGSGEVPRPMAVTAVSNVTLPSGNGLTRKGFYFGGWNTSPNGLGTNYGEGSSFTPAASNITLYARWYIPLSENFWVDSNITSTTGGGGILYTFSVTSGKTYTVSCIQTGYINSLNVKLSAVYSNGTTIFTDVNPGTSQSRFTAITTGISLSSTVFLWVTPRVAGTTGSFAITFASADNTRGPTYIISFDANGGTGELPPQMTAVTGTTITLPGGENLTRAGGYAFIGWTHYQPVYDWSTHYRAGDSYYVFESTTLLARWIRSYTVSFDANGGSGSMSDQDFTVGANLSLSANGFNRTGYTFEGWARSSNGAAVYADREYITQVITAGETVTLYAVWRANTYTVRYDANATGVTGSMGNQSFTYNTPQDLRANGFIRNAYVFMGWATSSGGPVVYADGQSGVNNLTATANGIVDLHAVWRPADYTVVYNKNAADANGTMSNSSHLFDVPQNLRTNNFARPGYAFEGWLTSPVSGGTNTSFYTDQQSVNNLTATTGGTVNLYAVWSRNPYYVQYNANGGSGYMETSTFALETDHVLSGNAFSRPGYTFAGWAESPSSGKKYNDQAIVRNLAARAFQTVNLYAVWQANTFTVRFNANGGSGSMSNQTFTYGSGQSLTRNAFTRTDYTFLGWAYAATTGVTAPVSDGQNGSALTTAAGATVDLYAVWKPITYYTVVFNANGGSNSMSSQRFAHDTPQNLSRNAFTRANHNFLGWADSPSATTAQYVNEENVNNLTATVGGTVNLYAVWKAITTYTVVFNRATAGYGEMSPQTFTHDVGQPLRANAFTHYENYRFIGWATSQLDAMLLNVTYTNQQYVTNLTMTPGGTVTLFAVWRGD